MLLNLALFVWLNAEGKQIPEAYTDSEKSCTLLKAHPNGKFYLVYGPDFEIEPTDSDRERGPRSLAFQDKTAVVVLNTTALVQSNCTQKK